VLTKTRGIVLQVTDYAESSIIAKIYTEADGMQSYLINGVRKNRARFSSNLFQPLTLVQLVAYHKPGRGLHRVSEITCDPHYTTIPYDFVKTSLAIFINEVLYKSIKEEEANEDLFGFLFHALQILDLETTDCSRFHLFLMGQLTRFFGFYPHGEFNDTTGVFNLQEGVFQAEQPKHPYYLNAGQAAKFYAFIKSDFDNFSFISLSQEEKKSLLHSFILYYELHLNYSAKIKSHEVLEDVMHD
jgi:DNA repair protein RecO (recombination protein O)